MKRKVVIKFQTLCLPNGEGGLKNFKGSGTNLFLNKKKTVTSLESLA